MNLILNITRIIIGQEGEEMPIRFKVVKIRNRTSAVVNGNSAYGLKYLLGTKVHAKEGTLGIMTFKRKSQAERFAEHLDFPSSWYCTPKYIVITVNGIGRGKYPERICTSVNTDNLDWFYRDGDHFCSNPPDGTMCYSSVEVLE